MGPLSTIWFYIQSLCALSLPLRDSIRPTLLFGPSIAWNLPGELDSKIEVGLPGFGFNTKESMSRSASSSGAAWPSTWATGRS
jgi:hypothetical protein